MPATFNPCFPAKTLSRQNAHALALPPKHQVGFQTGWFGLADGCDVAGAALKGAAKERAAATRAAAAADAAAGSAAMSVAGFPGQSVVDVNGKLYFPLMGDQTCRAGAQELCPADRGADASDRMAGMLRHHCDTGKGMSGAPLWIKEGTREAGAAASFGLVDGFPGYRGLAASDGDDAAAPASSSNRAAAPAVVVGLVSRHVGDCPWGADCTNLAAPMDARTVGLIRGWASRGRDAYGNR